MTEDQTQRARKLFNLYHATQEQAWNGEVVLGELIERHGVPSVPTAQRAAFGRVLTALMWGELAAWKVAAQLADRVVPLEAKMGATGQAFDEARHFFVLRDYLTHAGIPLERPGGWARSLLEQVLSTSSTAQKIVGMQLTIESIAIAVFAHLRHREVEPVLTELLTFFERDEARHIGMGAQVLPILLPPLGLGARLGVLLFQMRLFLRAVFTLRDLEPDLEALGLEVSEIVHQVARRVTGTTGQVFRRKEGTMFGARRLITRLLYGAMELAFGRAQRSLMERLRRSYEAFRLGAPAPLSLPTSP